MNRFNIIAAKSLRNVTHLKHTYRRYSVLANYVDSQQNQSNQIRSNSNRTDYCFSRFAQLHCSLPSEPDK